MVVIYQTSITLKVGLVN